MSNYGLPDMLDSFIFEGLPNYKNISSAIRLASPSVELTSAVGAILIPTIQELAPIYQMIADLYSGVPDQNWIVQKPSYANFAVEDLLVVADKVPVIEFARTFTGAEINRFRATILAISQNAKDLDGLEENISTFNHFVKSYEKDKKRLNLVNLSGFILGQAAKARGIPFASWLIKILQKHVLKQVDRSQALSEILDQMEANIVGNFPNAVLVSRMKSKLKDQI
jgi:3-methyladenine DNA glycosylase Tag